MPAQFIYAANGQPAFVVIPYAEFTQDEANADGEPPSKSSLLAADGFTLRLPLGKPGYTVDVRQLVEVWLRRGTTSMAVNARKQSYSEFKRETLNSLDPILRRCFLPKDSPYKNTMQATVHFVDGLVETGVFARTIVSGPGYYRPVLGIEIDDIKARAFLEKYGQPDRTINPMEFILPFQD